MVSASNWSDDLSSNFPENTSGNVVICRGD